MVCPGHGVCPRGSACQGQRLCPCLPWPAASAPFGTLPAVPTLPSATPTAGGLAAYPGGLARSPGAGAAATGRAPRSAQSATDIIGCQTSIRAFPPWLATFERFHADLEPSALSDIQRRRLRESEGEYALSQALYLALAPSMTQTTEVLEQQLHLFAQAIDQGVSPPGTWPCIVRLKPWPTCSGLTTLPRRIRRCCSNGPTIDARASG